MIRGLWYERMQLVKTFEGIKIDMKPRRIMADFASSEVPFFVQADVELVG
jgi:hypothetical protein